MDLREIGLGGCGLNSTVSGQGPVAGCCECGDEPSGSCTTELVKKPHKRRRKPELACSTIRRKFDYYDDDNNNNNNNRSQSILRT
jgi:hypothetical protein